MLWTIVVFLLLLAILKRFAWPAILGAVEAREKALEEQLAEAERNRAEAAKLLAEHKKLVGDAQGAGRRRSSPRPDRWRRRSARWRWRRRSRSRPSCWRGLGARSPPSVTARSPICVGRRWTSRSRPRPSSSVSGSDRETDRKLVHRLPRDAGNQPLSRHDDRPQLRRGALRARRALQADSVELRRPDRRGGRGDRDHARGAGRPHVASGTQARQGAAARRRSAQCPEGVRAVPAGGGEAGAATAPAARSARSITRCSISSSTGSAPALRLPARPTSRSGGRFRTR